MKLTKWSTVANSNCIQVAISGPSMFSIIIWSPSFLTWDGGVQMQMLDKHLSATDAQGVPLDEFHQIFISKKVIFIAQ